MARWWRRGDSEPSSPQGNSAPAVTGSTSPAPVQRAAWQDLPPIRPTVTATRPVAPLDTFTASLATSHNPSFLAPLGHVVDPDGPSGHVDGLARPVVPQTVSSGPELAVATRPSPVNTAVQRLLSPIMRFADNEPAPAPVPRPAAASLPPEQPAEVTVDPPVRQLSSTTSYSAAPTAFTSAPEQDTATPRPVVSDLPVVSSATSSSMPTVSRHVADPEAEHHDSGADHSDHDHSGSVHADHDHSGHDHSGESGGADAGSAGSSNSGHDVAPLLGDSTAAAGQSTAAGQDHSTEGESTAAAMGLAAHVQRSAAGPAPTRSPGLGAPLNTSGSSSFSSSTPPLPASSTAPTIGSSEATSVSSTPTTPSPPARDTSSLQRVPESQPALDLRSGPAPPAGAPVQRSDDSSAVTTHVPVVQTHADTSAGDPPETADGDAAADAPVLGMSALMRVLDPAAPAGTQGPFGVQRSSADVAAPGQTVPAQSSRPLGLGAPLSSTGSIPGVQRQVSTSGSTGSTTGSANSGGTTAGTTPMRIQTGNLPADRSTAATGSAEPGTVQRFADSTELVLPAPSVQRVGDTSSPVPSGVAEPVESPTMSSESFGEPEPSAPTEGLVIAPLLGAMDGETAHSITGPGATDASSAGAQVPTGSAPTSTSSAHSAPAVQRSESSSAGTGSRLPRLPSSPMSPSLDRSGLGAPLTGGGSQRSGSNQVLSQEVPLQRMFDPGAAAIASGAAYSDSPNSVVFPAPVTSAMPTTPTLGSSSGNAPAVQRFGLPSASSLMDRAKGAATGYVDSARQAAGGYADTARNTAGGYLTSATQAAGGYADQARGFADNAVSSAGGYLSSARNAAGGVADQAMGAASGALDSAQAAAGGLVDQAGGAVNNAATAVQGAVGNATDAAGGAIAGLQNAAGNAASGAADAVAGAAGAVAGAAGAAGALPTDIDELARRLFDPLSARLKSELWLDRERAGMVTDLRR